MSALKTARINVFFQEAEVIFTAHFSFLDQVAQERHVLVLDYKEADQLRAYLANNDMRTLRVSNNEVKLEVAPFESGKMCFEFTVERERNGAKNPVVIAEAADIKALVKLLRVWLRENPGLVEVPVFGLA